MGAGSILENVRWRVLKVVKEEPGASSAAGFQALHDLNKLSWGFLALVEVPPYLAGFHAHAWVCRISWIPDVRLGRAAGGASFSFCRPPVMGKTKKRWPEACRRGMSLSFYLRGVGPGP